MGTRKAVPGKIFLPGMRVRILLVAREGPPLVPKLSFLRPKAKVPFRWSGRDPRDKRVGGKENKKERKRRTRTNATTRTRTRTNLKTRTKTQTRTRAKMIPMRP